jgi:hypothetical protein|tara:strand:- start:302 stop:481 length:180 start_codon:yes stop_codon:yes gene_type:complete
MKYFKHVITENGAKRVQSYNPEGTTTWIPEAPDNMDYARMMEEISAGESTIEEVNDTPE